MPDETLTTARRYQLVSVVVFLLGLGVLHGKGVAQQPQPEASKSHLLAGFGAQTPAFDRFSFEVGYRGAASTRSYAFAVHLRVGRYSVEDVLGRDRAQADGFASGARPLYASVFYGIQGPPPLLRSVRGSYIRVSGGVTSYLGQSASNLEIGTSQPIRGIGPRFAPGAEFALGIGGRAGRVRPWSELRVSGEYLGRSGLGLIGPMLAIGADLSAP